MPLIPPIEGRRGPGVLDLPQQRTEGPDTRPEMDPLRPEGRRGPGLTDGPDARMEIPGNEPENDPTRPEGRRGPGVLDGPDAEASIHRGDDEGNFFALLMDRLGELIAQAAADAAEGVEAAKAVGRTGTEDARRGGGSVRYL